LLLPVQSALSAFGLSGEQQGIDAPLGVWWWRPEAEWREHLAFAAAQGVSEAYVSMGWAQNPSRWREDTAEIGAASAG